MQIERLIKMIFYIINREHVTAKELADYFNVSTRTIYRDVNTLTLAGIPIISTKGTGGGISLIDGYSLNKSLFSKEEQQNIFQGLQMLQATKFPNAEMALNKISAIFGKSLVHKWLDIDFTFWGSDRRQKVDISELQYAILNKYTLTFDYFNSELQKSNRTIDPLQLIFKSRTWYIIGYCHSKQEIRIFRMSRMKHIRVLSETFERTLPNDYSLSTDCEEKCDFPVFKLKFAPEIAYRLYDDFQESQIEACIDGSFIVTFQYQLTDWTFNYLLSFGKYVEIIEPKIARTMLKNRALEIARIYD